MIVVVAVVVLASLSSLVFADRHLSCASLSLPSREVIDQPDDLSSYLANEPALLLSSPSL